MDDNNQDTTKEAGQSSAAPEKTSSVKSNLGIPIAIVIAAALVSGAIIYSGNSSSQVANVGTAGTDSTQATPEADIVPVSEADHIRGNPNAPIMIVEYSDYDCPFCKNFHGTMNQIMAEYGTEGKVSWVYRHFPLEQLHPNAPKLAEASECVAELGGNEAFWTFTDLVFGERSTNEQTDISRLPEFAETAGVDRGAFESCFESGKYTDAIAEDLQQAVNAGARGTPYSVVLIGDQRGVINGAQPYANVKQVIDNLLAQIEGVAE